MRQRFLSVHSCRTALVALAVVVVSLQPAMRAQQNLNISLFERSLEQLRLESGIPGLSAAIVQNRNPIPVWDRGFGMADVERSIGASPDTPYPIGGLTQVLAATLVLQRIDRGDFEINDRIQRWTSIVPEPNATVGQVLRHTTTGSYQYAPDRFAAVAPVVEHYARPLPFRKVLADEILDTLAMHSSVPGHDMEQPSPLEVPLFEAADLNRYRAVLQRLAVPYRVDIRNRPSRGEYPPRSLTAGSGLISSVRDLARFDAALDDGDLVSGPALAAMRQRGGPNVPTGLGWFVQTYNDEIILWQFGNIPNAFSSLIVKVPRRELTLILLANSDGLSAPFALEQGDVTRSLFARVFLRTFVP